MDADTGAFLSVGDSPILPSAAQEGGEGSPRAFDMGVSLPGAADQEESFKTMDDCLGYAWRCSRLVLPSGLSVCCGSPLQQSRELRLACHPLGDEGAGGPNFLPDR